MRDELTILLPSWGLQRRWLYLLTCACLVCRCALLLSLFLLSCVSSKISCSFVCVVGYLVLISRGVTAGAELGATSSSRGGIARDLLFLKLEEKLIPLEQQKIINTTTGLIDTGTVPPPEWP